MESLGLSFDGSDPAGREAEAEPYEGLPAAADVSVAFHPLREVGLIRTPKEQPSGQRTELTAKLDPVALPLSSWS